MPAKRFDLQFLFREEELSILNGALPPGLDEELSVLECDLRVVIDSTNAFSGLSKSRKFPELETGKILSVVWVETVEAILRAVSEVARGENEAEAYLMGSQFWLRFVGENGKLKLFLRGGDEVDRHIIEATTLTIARDLFRSCQDSTVILLGRFTNLRFSRVYASLQSKLESVGSLLSQAREKQDRTSH